MKDTKAESREVPLHPTLGLRLDVAYFRGALDTKVIEDYTDALFAWDAATYKGELLGVLWLESGAAKVGAEWRAALLEVAKQRKRMTALRPFFHNQFEALPLPADWQARFRLIFEEWLAASDFNSLHWEMSGLVFSDLLPGQVE
jgi:hypothetical protein